MERDAHLSAQSRVYGRETWSVYEQLDRSLHPRGPDVMHDVASQQLHPSSCILDVGCGKAAHLVRLVEANAATSAVGIDPVRQLVEEARRSVHAARLGDRIEIAEAALPRLPLRDDRFDLVWCRDVLAVVDPLEASVGELARVLRPGGHAVVYTSFATELLDAREAALLGRHLSAVYANLDETRMEAAFGASRLCVVRKDVIGTEWREHAEERTQPASRALLRLARLRRQRERIVASAGRDIYDHVEANLHWVVFQFLGKLVPTLYLLRKIA